MIISRLDRCDALPSWSSYFYFCAFKRQSSPSSLGNLFNMQIRLQSFCLKPSGNFTLWLKPEMAAAHACMGLCHPAQPTEPPSALPPLAHSFLSVLRPHQDCPIPETHSLSSPHCLSTTLHAPPHTQSSHHTVGLQREFVGEWKNG